MNFAMHGKMGYNVQSLILKLLSGDVKFYEASTSIPSLSSMSYVFSSHDVGMEVLIFDEIRAGWKKGPVPQ